VEKTSLIERKYHVPKGEKIKHGNRGPAVVWNIADMITLYGTVFGIEVTHEELRLLFGSRTVQAGRREKTVMVSDRIIISPLTAKRMLVLLRKIMARHQLPFGMGNNDLHAFMETSN
jgi:hypothetical protein